MEHPIIQIKNAITALLKGIDPDTDVFYEEIKGTEEKHGLDEPETYYFVDIIPNGNETVDRFFTDMGVLVDIAYHEKTINEWYHELVPRLNVDHIDKICEALDCTITDLLEYIPNERKTTGKYLILEEHGNRKQKKEKD